MPSEIRDPSLAPRGRLRTAWARRQMPVLTDLAASVAAAGHLAGSLGFELSTNFVTYLGWLYRYGTPLTLIGETPEQVAEARRELVRIGVDRIAGAATGDIDALADGRPLRSYPVSDFTGLAKAREQGPVQVLDARRNDATHLPARGTPPDRRAACHPASDRSCAAWARRTTTGTSTVQIGTRTQIRPAVTS